VKGGQPVVPFDRVGDPVPAQRRRSASAASGTRQRVARCERVADSAPATRDAARKVGDSSGAAWTMARGIPLVSARPLRLRTRCRSPARYPQPAASSLTIIRAEHSISFCRRCQRPASAPFSKTEDPAQPRGVDGVVVIAGTQCCRRPNQACYAGSELQTVCVECRLGVRRASPPPPRKIVDALHEDEIV
jgi:hypothetical protein